MKNKHSRGFLCVYGNRSPESTKNRHVHVYNDMYNYSFARTPDKLGYIQGHQFLM